MSFQRTVAVEEATRFHVMVRQRLGDVPQRCWNALYETAEAAIRVEAIELTFMEYEEDIPQLYLEEVLSDGY